MSLADITFVDSRYKTPETSNSKKHNFTPAVQLGDLHSCVARGENVLSLARCGDICFAAHAGCAAVVGWLIKQVCG